MPTPTRPHAPAAAPIPTYRLHRQSGQAVVTLNRRDFTLGPYGTPESRQRYNRLIGQWLANDRRPIDRGLLELRQTAAGEVQRRAAPHVLPSPEGDRVPLQPPTR